MDSGSPRVAGGEPLHGASVDPAVDEENRDWIRGLTSEGPDRQRTCDRLYRYLLRAAHAEAHRRTLGLRLYGPELDDLAHQAAADALLTITSKLPTFRGESRFTTWAYRFVIFDVAAKVNRHFWQRVGVPFGDEDWARVPERFGIEPHTEAEAHDLMDALHRAVDRTLTPKQRIVFVAIALNDVPMEVLADELHSTRNAIYKVMFDARRKLRQALAIGGYIPELEGCRPDTATPGFLYPA